MKNTQKSIALAWLGAARKDPIHKDFNGFSSPPTRQHNN